MLEELNHRADIIEDLLQESSYFIYDLDGLRQHAANIKKGAANVFFACKANPLSSLIQILHEVGFNFDVASNGELEQIRSLGITGDKIIMTGPAKPEKLILLGLDNRIKTFVIESARQLFILITLLQEARLKEKEGYVPNILLRLQIKWDYSTERSVLGGSDISQFGMDFAGIMEIIPIVKANDRFKFIGFHVFQWGNILDVTRLSEIWQESINVCNNFGVDFDVLDVGGGLGVPYSDGERAIIWNDVNELIIKFKEKNKLKEFWLELGRYLVAPYGFYCTKVVDRKVNYGREMLILQSGVNHIARSALVGQFFPITLLRKSDTAQIHFAVYGPLCTSLDFLGFHMIPGDVKPGDILVFSFVGAYGFTESMPFFLCHDIAGEAVLKRDGIEIIRKARTARVWMK